MVGGLVGGGNEATSLAVAAAVESVNDTYLAL